MQPFGVESCGFRQNVQKLTGNTNNGQISNFKFIKTTKGSKASYKLLKT